MHTRNNSRPFGLRLARLMALNILIALATALIWFWAEAQSHPHSLIAHIADSLIHATVYGLAFGLTMPYVAERLAAMRPLLSWLGILFSLALIAVLSTLVVQLTLLGFAFERADDFRRIFYFKSATVFVIALIIGLCVHTYEKIQWRIEATQMQLRMQELEKDRAIKLATEARLASLESRLHPHFLFNTLNSISALILEDPALAEQMVQRLAALLRASLDACTQNTVPLRRELKLATDYLEIERVRFRDRLSYSIEIKPELETLSVPPLTIQPLVENSVKFAVTPNPAGGRIKISARLSKSQLTLEVWDDGPGFDVLTIPRGHGLDNLQARLAALLGDDAKLSVAAQKEGTTVTVSVPLNGGRVAV
ncbi:MAG TPA: histidine kinase [Pyrinomonadaceae bacterium]